MEMGVDVVFSVLLTMCNVYFLYLFLSSPVMLSIVRLQTECITITVQ